ncbi:MAG: signal peptidase I [Blastocatellia bacterium]
MKKKLFWGAIVVVILGCAVFFGVFAYGFRIMSLPTGGMANTIIPGEQVAVTKFFGAVQRGDIVVFRYPKNPSILYLKRVIGLPGENIEVRGKQVFINGQALAEKRVKVDLAMEEPAAQKSLRELAEEGAGEYRVFYDKLTWDEKEEFTEGMSYAVKTPYKIPAGQYFVMGDARDNSQDSRFWGTVAADAILWKAYMITSSPETARVFTKLK